MLSMTKNLPILPTNHPADYAATADDPRPWMLMLHANMMAPYVQCVVHVDCDFGQWSPGLELIFHCPTT